MKNSILGPWDPERTKTERKERERREERGREGAWVAVERMTNSTKNNGWLQGEGGLRKFLEVLK